MKSLLARLALAACAFGAAASAHAGGDLYWSIGIHAPLDPYGASIGTTISNVPRYHAPAPVIVQPAPIYYAPAPIYYAPPVYVRPRPIYYGHAPVYVKPRHPHWQGHHHHPHHWKRPDGHHHRPDWRGRHDGWRDGWRDRRDRDD